MEVRVITSVTKPISDNSRFFGLGCVLFLRVFEGAVAIAAAHVCYSLH